MSVGVRWGSFTMNGTADGAGDVFVIEDIEGLDSPEVDLTSSDRYDDGNILTSARFKQRELLIKGNAYAPSNVAWGAFRVRNKIKAAFTGINQWSTGSLWLDIPSPGTAYVVNARLGGKIHFPTPKANVQPFEIPMTCDDPRLYSQTENDISITGNPTLVNAGNASTYVTATFLVGGVTNPYLENTTYGERLQLTGTPPANLNINFLYKEIRTSGGVVQEWAGTPRVWWALRPGNNFLTLHGSYRLQWRSAWW